MDATGARHVGARLLGEAEEESLEELLDSLRASFAGNPSRHRSADVPMAELSALISRYQRATQSAPPPLVSVSGRYLPFLYHLVSTLVAPPHGYAVVVVDAEGAFDATRLVGTSASAPAAPADLAHVHVYRPAAPRGPEQVRAALDAAAHFMLYGSHASRGRAWWGAVVVGGGGGLVNTGWRGWLRVDREEVSGFAAGVSVEEALAQRDGRQAAVDAAGWAASPGWGSSYVWKDG
ncbi:hypothetical protein F4802DRAFT_525740 [Xylaria palmicola]|nr:hypothetical protein F4802DRAFT_525740 [Xylaria palmicola]